jgi:hypothetical protein
LGIVGAITYAASIFAFVGMTLIEDVKKVGGIILHKNGAKI